MNADRGSAIGAPGRTSTDAGCKNFLESDKSGHYSSFKRCLTGWHAFEKAATSHEPHWFKDLLSLWRPSGHCSGKEGLRVAIRNGYLNFYRLGQSVARVECVSGELRADVHYKYVLDEPPPGFKTKLPYLRLITNGVFYLGKRVADYDGPSTLDKWIAAAGKNHAKPEKSIVDELVEKNDNVIDLETAIPAWDLRTAAVRIDLVAIEDGRVVFWEVKMVDDKRIRCEAAFKADKFPHVLEQLSHYRVFLKQDAHIERVESAYRNTAKLLVKLRALADEIGPTLALGPSIIAASQAGRLAVDREAALVVVDLPEDNKRPWKSWKASHEGKLKGKIPMLVLESPERLVFAGAI